MEFTKEQLRKIIQEEFQISIEEGEIDEGFLDRLFGKDKRSTEFVTGREVKDVVNKVINSISELVRIASRQGDMRLADKAAELKRQAMSLSVQEVPSGNAKMPNPEEFSKGSAKLPSSLDRGGRLSRQRELSENKRKRSK